jgi:acetylornithine deacetylase/succinyl-diaminopimelate desuccinylase-like protein
MQNTQKYINENKNRFVEELFSLLKIPSVSADSKYKNEVFLCANRVAELLQSSGANNVEILPTKGYPVVYGEKIINPLLPTVLVYGHYDVQPADPIDLWDSAAFEPIIKKTKIHPEGAIFARGAADDKGQFFMHIKAFEAMNATHELPCNIKFLIEGEEEVGSDNLGEFLVEHKEKLKNDVILISDTEMISKDQPSISVGLRGLSYIEVSVEGAKMDLHSGVYGGAVPNPILILSQMIGSLIDEKGKITIPHFYDKVIDLSEKERTELNKAPFDLEEFKKSIEINDIIGEKGYSVIEKTGSRPSLDVNGIWGGYTGEGAKTVLPAKASAKISMRLVPDQSYEEITQLFINHFQAIAPQSVKITCTPHHGGKPYLMEVDNIGFLAAKKALSHTFKKTALPVRGGGSIPIVAMFEEVLGSKSILLGLGLNSDVIHSPNENFGLFNFYKGIETIPYFFKYYTELQQIV